MTATVLITGASTGFGRDAAERLARRGHRVFATMRDIDGRNAANRNALQALAREETLWLRVLELDVTSDDSVRRAVETALNEAEHIDVVVNNAGIASIGVTEAYTPEQFLNMLDVNLVGMVRVNRAVLPSMRERRTGLLIHISSGAGRVAVPAMGPYSPTKFAVEAYADTIRYELSPFGIDSVLIEPGIYNTGIFDRIVLPADSDRVDSYGLNADYAERVRNTFLGVVQTPGAAGTEDVAEAIVGLVEMNASERPFRTVVPPPIAELFAQLNPVCDGLRPVVARIFNVPELAGAPGVASAGR
jgi:NAD(P)-dependent dehydrogenase (short-subunit alcohol dehydrogenase family)